MSVVIEELDGPDHAPEEVQVLAPGPEAHQAHEERFHDATDASSDDDEWQDVTEHFDAATLNDQPQRQARFSDEGSDSGSSFQVVDHPEDMPSDAAAVPPVPAGHDSPATAAAPEDRRAPPTPGSEQQQQGADTVDAPPPPLLRPPDDFWDSSRPSRLPSGGFGFGNDLHSSDAPAGGHGADGARGSTQEGDEAMRVHDEDLAEGEEQPPEPVETLTEEEIKERTAEASALKLEGNKLFAAQRWEAAQEQYSKALDRAPVSDPQRAVYFANRAACALKLKQWSDAATDCTAAVAADDKYVKAYLRRATAYEEADDLERSLADYKKVLELDPGNAAAAAKEAKLQPVVEERREKMKEEMIGKLKELGNTVLGKFGLSVDNFKAVKGPDGGYSLSFQQ